MVSHNFLLALLLASLYADHAKSTPVPTERDEGFVAGDPLTEEELNSAHSFSEKGESLVPNMDFGNLNEKATNLVGGDMVPPKGKNVLLSAVKWPNAQIPYVISAGYTTEQRQIIAMAMSAFHNATCIRFLPRKSTQADYITITKTGTGCNSAVGKAGGNQKLSLDDGCLSKSYVGIAIHEMMHAIGFAHEHQRPDQEDYIDVLYDNIQPDWQQWFQPLPETEVNTLNLPYDIQSVMHYVSFSSAAVDSSQPIILAKDGSYTGNDQRLTCLDAQKINKYYNCFSG